MSPGLMIRWIKNVLSISARCFVCLRRRGTLLGECFAAGVRAAGGASHSDVMSSGAGSRRPVARPAAGHPLLSISPPGSNRRRLAGVFCLSGGPIFKMLYYSCFYGWLAIGRIKRTLLSISADVSIVRRRRGHSPRGRCFALGVPGCGGVPSTSDVLSRRCSRRHVARTPQPLPR